MVCGCSSCSPSRWRCAVRGLRFGPRVVRCLRCVRRVCRVSGSCVGVRTLGGGCRAAAWSIVLAVKSGEDSRKQSRRKSKSEHETQIAANAEPTLSQDPGSVRSPRTLTPVASHPRYRGVGLRVACQGRASQACGPRQSHISACPPETIQRIQRPRLDIDGAVSVLHSSASHLSRQVALSLQPSHDITTWVQGRECARYA